MPWSQRIDTVHRVVFVRYRDTFTAETAFASQRSLRDDPEFAPDLRALYDCRGVTKMELTNSEMRGIAKSIRYDETGRRAVVVAQKVNYGLARMSQIFRDEEAATFKVFEDLAEAREWLGID